jgi:hypothetical protein
MSQSVCKLFSCPHFKKGTKKEGVTYGYGCDRFTVANHCPVNAVAGVTATPYELFWDDNKVAPMHETAASAVIAGLKREKTDWGDQWDWKWQWYVKEDHLFDDDRVKEWVGFIYGHDALITQSHRLDEFTLGVMLHGKPVKLDADNSRSPYTLDFETLKEAKAEAVKLCKQLSNVSSLQASTPSQHQP